MKYIQYQVRNRLTHTVKFSLYVATTFLYVVFSLNPSAHAAASATMRLTPATGTVVNGSSISLTIQIVAGSNQITGAQACITFDTAKLALTNTDTSSSALPSVTPGSSSDCSAGETQVSRFAFNSNTGTVTPASGTFTLAVLTFQAKQAGTTAVINFDNAKSYIKDNATTDANGNYTSILTGTAGSTLTLNAPQAPAPDPTPVSPPATNTSPAGTVTPKPNTPAKQAAVTDTNHTTTTTSPVKAPTQAASDDVKVTPTSASGTSSKTAGKKNTSHKKVYIISGAVIVALIAAGLLIKFIGAPGLPMFSSRKVIPGASGGTTPPTNPGNSTLANIPDPQLPTPSSIVQPTQPPSNGNNHLPH